MMVKRIRMTHGWWDDVVLSWRELTPLIAEWDCPTGGWRAHPKSCCLAILLLLYCESLCWLPLSHTPRSPPDVLQDAYARD